MNNWTGIGRLTRDPEVRYAGETAVARFSVAIDRPAKAGEEKKTDFPNIVVFGKQAENCEKFLTKGLLVGIEGRIQTGSYTNKEGQKVYTTDIVANRVQFLEWKEKGAESSKQENTDGIPEGFSQIEDEDIPF